MLTLLEYFLAAARKAASRNDSPAMQEWEQQVVDQVLKEFGLPERPVFRKTDRAIPEGEE